MMSRLAGALCVAILLAPTADTSSEVTARKRSQILIIQTVPGIILRKTTAHIIDRVGQEFFDAALLFGTSRGDGDLYVLSWYVDIPGVRMARYWFLVGVDGEGNLKKPVDLPHAQFLQGENFSINVGAEQAREAAENALDVDKPLVVWDMQFTYDPSLHTGFVWRVTGKKSHLFWDSARSATIDACTGEVLSIIDGSYESNDNDLKQVYLRL